MNASTARLIAYLAGVALGIFMTVYGVVTGDPALVTSGLALVGTGGLAGGALAKQTTGGKYGK